MSDETTFDEQPNASPDSKERSESAVAATPDVEPAGIRPRVIEVLKTVYDPEIPVDIYELGLIYEVAIRDEATAYIQMTLTSPMCPVAEILPQEVEEKVRSVEGVEEVALDLVWDPPWSPDMMSEAAKLTLNF
ncbi:MAG: SUF system Fe-S cluster assembly protein [Myxococcota bacterium]|nr:SUF system Fe-S cluster assembly protein [Myxococcota bacterium]